MRRLLITLTTLTLTVVIATSAAARDHVIDESSESSFLFVVSGSSGSIDGDTLTLDGVPAVVYFSDRPARIAGHMSIEDFIASWDRGVDSFAADPPNAVLSILDGDVVEVPIVLTGVAADESGLRFDVSPLQDTLPQDISGAASLFIDARLDGLILN